MNTSSPIKIADRVRATIERGFKKKAIAEHIGLSRPTFDARLKDNSWQHAEIEKLIRLGII
ncbi:hypothetical protein [Nibribacter koreensis]|uniref:Homeodomain-like domain-containing protein n=1 Tax=Nibribacter koreensis TaxID=1084519 RepID=A0ABP8FBN6_9BACT